MRVFKKVKYSDGGPNDRGTIIGYKAVLKNENPPKNENGFELWHEITFSEYLLAKKEARKEMDLFTF
jgi:hypothetical protein